MGDRYPYSASFGMLSEEAHQATERPGLHRPFSFDIAAFA
jgi:hypothetical protein